MNAYELVRKYLCLRKRFKRLAERLAVLEAGGASSSYLRPDGISGYFRPDGISTYLRP